MGGPEINFYQRVPFKWDIIVTNPPFSAKDAFLRHAYTLGTPFAFLLPLEALAGKSRHALYRHYGMEVLIPSKKIEFTGGKTRFPCFTAWFCWGLHLPSSLTFVEATW